MRSSRALALLSCVCVSFALSACAPEDAEQGETEAVGTSEEALSTGLSLVVRPKTAGLVATVFYNREVASRRIWGCYDYDVLGGSGWFPSTWYRDYTFAPTAEGFAVSLQRTIRASLCAARMDGVNGVALELSDPSLPGGKMTGTFSIAPDGESARASVTCTKTTGPELACETAHVKLPSRGQLVVDVSIGGS